MQFGFIRGTYIQVYSRNTYSELFTCIFIFVKVFDSEIQVFTLIIMA